MLLNVVKLVMLQLSGVEISWVGIFLVEIFRVGIVLGGNFLVGNCPSGSYPGCELSGWELSWVRIFSDGSFPDGNCPVGIIWVAICRVGVFILPKNLLEHTKNKILNSWNQIKWSLSPAKRPYVFWKWIYTFFNLLLGLISITWSKRNVTLMVRAFHSKSASCLIWCPQVFCKWTQCPVICCNLIKLRDSMVMWLYWSWPLILSCNSDKFVYHRYCDTTLPNLVDIGLLQVGIKHVWLFTWPQKTTRLDYYMMSWVEAPHCI